MTHIDWPKVTALLFLLLFLAAFWFGTVVALEAVLS